jgi:hypothetical protein
MRPEKNSTSMKGWLPVPRGLFPAGANRYWDVVIFAEEDPTKFWTQPIWFWILLVENGQVKEAHHSYHHLPIAPWGEPQARDFYKVLRPFLFSGGFPFAVLQRRLTRA